MCEPQSELDTAFNSVLAEMSSHLARARDCLRRRDYAQAVAELQLAEECHCRADVILGLRGSRVHPEALLERHIETIMLNQQIRKELRMRSAASGAL